MFIFLHEVIITAFSKLEESHEIDTLIEAGKPEAITILIVLHVAKHSNIGFIIEP